MRTYLKITFDGDTVSFNGVYTEEANQEIADYLKTRTAYLRAGGGLAFDPNIETVELVLRSMTGPALSSEGETTHAS